MDNPIAAPSLAQPVKQACGVVMPISAIDGCEENHWTEVQRILFDAIGKAHLKPELVSDGQDVGVIQARIVKNLYENPLVVCDVSAKNANVMFELGLRLAFDKPTIIVIDDKTSFSFDTSPIEHLRYPRDLRHSKIESFKQKLTEKLLAVMEQAKDSKYPTFLQSFGSFTAAKLEKKELAPDEFISFVTQKLTGLEESTMILRRSLHKANRSVNATQHRKRNKHSGQFSNIVHIVRTKIMILESDDQVPATLQLPKLTLCGQTVYATVGPITENPPTCRQCINIKSRSDEVGPHFAALVL